MIRILGNSAERVHIKDLSDVVYYKQHKEYTDQEYASSKDLKRLIQEGQLILMEVSESIRGSSLAPSQIENYSNANINDIKKIISELIPEIQKNSVTGDSLKAVLQGMAPLIVDMVRQELSKIKVVQENKSSIKSVINSEELLYTPNVSTEGMTSSIEAKKTEVSNNSSEDALAALRKLKK